MNPKVAPLADQFKLNTGLINKAIKGLADNDEHKRVNDKCSSLHWIVGHITGSRQHITELLGTKIEFKDAEKFYGGKPLQEPSVYPSMVELKESFDAVTEGLMKRLEEVNDDDIAKKCETKFPVVEETLLGGIAFIAYHEAYHVGQMSYIRKQLGYEGLAG